MMKNLKKKAGVCILTALLTCVLCAAPVLAAENNGEAGITPDPPEIIEPAPPSDPVVPSQPEPPVSDPTSVPSEPDVPVTSEPDPPPVSSSSSEKPSGNTSQITSRPNTVSSRVVYSDPDPRESYVEYIPPSQNNGNQNHTTHAETPVAVAPAESKTELLSSQDWSALLNTSSASNNVSASSELAPINGIFSREEDAHSVSNILIIGIILLALGVIGVGFFIYSQFIYKRRKPKDDSDDYDDYDDSGSQGGDGHSDISRNETTPLPYVPSERDISSFSDPHMKPPNPLQHPEPPKPPAPPKKNRVEIEDIDWDQFFKDNNNK